MRCNDLVSMSSFAQAGIGVTLLPDDQAKPDLIRLFELEKEFKKNNERFESTAPNLAMAWYTLAIEYKMNKKFSQARDALNTARRLVPASSNLNELIEKQLNSVSKKLEDSL